LSYNDSIQRRGYYARDRPSLRVTLAWSTSGFACGTELPIWNVTSWVVTGVKQTTFTRC